VAARRGRSRRRHGRCGGCRRRQPVAVSRSHSVSPSFSRAVESGPAGFDSLLIPVPQALTWTRTLGHACLVLLALLVIAASASAQTASEAEEPVPGRFRAGPVRFTPSIILSDVGVDTNVFNDPITPESDTTATIGPAIEIWMRAGRARITGKSSNKYVYFNRFDDQRSWSTASEARLELPLARIKPFIGGSYNNTRERGGIEIDARVRRQDQSVLLGTEIALSSKTTLVLSGTQRLFVFDDAATFRSESLADNLDRTARSETAQLRFALTPLTTFVVTSDAVQDRFDLATARNADSIRVMPGFEFKPFALISGRAAVGFRRFNVLDPGIDDYNGVVANIDASYAIRATKLTFGWMRDVDYSYATDTPYYLQTGVPLMLTQRITSKWDVIGRATWQRLRYVAAATGDSGTAALAGDITDRASLYGMGLGYRVGDILRLGLDVNYFRRESPLTSSRTFDGLRAGFSVSYGLPQ
jgi:hypothetical protein